MVTTPNKVLTTLHTKSQVMRMHRPYTLITYKPQIKQLSPKPASTLLEHLLGSLKQFVSVPNSRDSQAEALKPDEHA